MTAMPDIVLANISPKAQELLRTLAQTSGTENLERVVEDLTFSIVELMQLIDTTRDPTIYPQDAIAVMTTVQAVLAKFTRFGSPLKESKG